MDLFQQTIANEVAKACPWMPPNGPMLTELHSQSGFRIFGFSLHSLEGERIDVNLIVASFDFVANPRLSDSLPDSFVDVGSMRLPIEGDDSYGVLTAKRERDFAFALCVGESEAEDFAKLMRRARRNVEVPDFFDWQLAVRIDEPTNKIVGAMSLDAALRSFYGAEALRACWEKVFDGPCPTKCVLGVVRYTQGLPFCRPDGQLVHIPPEQAVHHPSLRKLSPEWSELGGLISGVGEREPPRLSHWVPAEDDKAQANEKLILFCSNVVRLVQLAHRYLDATFTCEFGSALTASNVDAEGRVQDLETFRSSRLKTITFEDEERTIFGDAVPMDRQLEDLALSIELIHLLCSKLGVPPTDVGVFSLAYQQYTGRTCPEELLATVRSLGSGQGAQRLCDRMYQDAGWIIK